MSAKGLLTRSRSAPPCTASRAARGEVLGMILSTWWGWRNVASIALSVVMAFFFGYGLTSLPLLRSGMTVRQVAPLAFASDTASITTMEIVDNLFIALLLFPWVGWVGSGGRRPVKR